MSLRRAKNKLREFHLREPRKIIPVNVEIPRYVYSIGYCVQVSYRSDKWNDNGKWIDYIHWWENPTLVCVPEETLEELDLGFVTPIRFDLGKDSKEAVTFLGNAIDFNLSEDDRSDIELVPEYNPEQMLEEELEKVAGSIAIPFCPKNGMSKDYVVCSPNGRIIYVISEDEGRLYAFINNKCRVTSHGIEG